MYPSKMDLVYFSFGSSRIIKAQEQNVNIEH